MWCWTPTLVGRAIRLRADGGQRTARPTGQLVCKLRREIIRVQIRGDDFRFRIVKPFKIGDDAAEGIVRRLRFQIADVLADENLVSDGQRDGIFQMRADGQNNFRRDEFHESLMFGGLWNSSLRLIWAAARNRERGAKPFHGQASRAQWNRPRAGRWDGCGRERHRRCRRAVPKPRVHRCKSARRSNCRSWQ